MSFSDLDDGQLIALLAAEERAVVEVRFKLALGQLEDTSALRLRRRQVARALCELRAREIAQGLDKGSLAQGGRGIAALDGAAGSVAGGFLEGVVEKLG